MQRLGVRGDIAEGIVYVFKEMNKLAKEYYETKGRVVAINSLGLITAVIKQYRSFDKELEKIN